MIINNILSELIQLTAKRLDGSPVENVLVDITINNLLGKTFTTNRDGEINFGVTPQLNGNSGNFRLEVIQY